MIELSLSRVRTVVQKDFPLQPSHFEHVLGRNNSALTKKSSEFHFGSFRWTVRLSPEPLDISDKVSVHLVREKTTKQHINKMLSKLRYRFFTGQGESKSLTDLRQEMLGCGDRGAGWVPAGKMEHLVTGTNKVSLAPVGAKNS